MKTIAKVAIGCGIAVVVAGIVAVVALGGAAWWLKGKTESMLGEQQKIEALQKKADQNPFTPPADGVLQEPRLVKFLEVRKRVYAVYETRKAEIEAMGQKKQADFGDVTKAFTWVNEVRLALAQALADVGMSQNEYAYHVEHVYKTLWAAEIEKSTGGKSASQVVSEAAQEMEKAMREAKREARAQGSHDAEEQAAEAEEQSAEGMEKAVEEAKALDVPKANLELFRKYEADIKKYAMSGLELIGL